MAGLASEALSAVVGDDVRRSGSRGQARGESLTPGLEPLVEHQRLEHRSRESFEEESRIGFARPEPFAQKRKVDLAHVPREGGTRASRNLLLHERGRRDVLN